MATVSTNIVAFFFQFLSGGGQNYGTQDLRTSSSAGPPQYSQGTPGNDIEETDFTVVFSQLFESSKGFSVSERWGLS